MTARQVDAVGGATMRLLGRWNWWAPGPLRLVYRRYGLKEA
ncbi:hypothetical protein [Catellatospora methionotrophica]